MVEEGDEKYHLGIQDQFAALGTTAYTTHLPDVILLYKIL